MTATDPNNAAQLVGVLAKLRSLGLCDYKSPKAAIMAMPLEHRRYAVAALELQQSAEIDEALHVTRDIVLLANAEKLDNLLGLRPVSKAEWDAAIEVAAYASRETPS